MAKTETIVIPTNLARLLIAEKEDLKDGQKYEDIQRMCKTLLKILLEAQK